MGSGKILDANQPPPHGGVAGVACVAAPTRAASAEPGSSNSCYLYTPPPPTGRATPATHATLRLYLLVVVLWFGALVSPDCLPRDIEFFCLPSELTHQSGKTLCVALSLPF